MINKAIIAVGIISILSGIAVWVVHIKNERDLFEQERNDAISANASVIEDNNYLLNEIRTRDADILARENFINELTVTTAGIKKELADAKNKLSAEELVCLESDVPIPYRDKLRQRSGGAGNEDGTSVPVGGVLPTVPVQ